MFIYIDIFIFCLCVYIYIYSILYGNTKKELQMESEGRSEA